MKVVYNSHQYPYLTYPFGEVHMCAQTDTENMGDFLNEIFGIPAESYTALPAYKRAELNERIEQALNTIGDRFPRQQNLIMKTRGLFGHPRISLDEASEKESVTPRRAEEILHVGLGKIKKSSLRSDVIAFFE